jgi:RNA polymerase sigma-70 factor (ECF subfamily)
MQKEDPKPLLERLFRSEYGKVVATLTHTFGTGQLENIEDAVQDALIKAMQLWGFTKVPDNPTAWLYKVAQNGIIDRLRKERHYVRFSGAVPFYLPENANIEALALDSSIGDSQLKMIFACCHPSLSAQYQLILSLKLIGGFSNRELSLALLKKEEAVAKAYTRAKRQLKAKLKSLESPVEIGLRSRLFVVLRVIYLLFSEGYSSNSGTQIIKKDICYEAIRLALLLRENPYCRNEQLEALLALMCFHASRFEARLDAKGELIDLEHQDRRLYSEPLIRIGKYHLEQAGRMQQQPSKYFLEAAVSFEHCRAAVFEETNWENILKLYDQQLHKYDSPIVALNRIVPFNKVHGPEKALAEFRLLEQHPDFRPGVLSNAILAEIYKELTQYSEATVSLKTAIRLSRNEVEKGHFKKKLRAMQMYVDQISSQPSR